MFAHQNENCLVGNSKFRLKSELWVEVTRGVSLSTFKYCGKEHMRKKQGFSMVMYFVPQ